MYTKDMAQDDVHTDIGSDMPIVDEDQIDIVENPKQHRWYLIWILTGALVSGIALSTILTWYLTKPSKIFIT